jgi:ABC-type nitrate/sulfonate/bicarbonate transport system substrate-binding protein
MRREILNAVVKKCRAISMREEEMRKFWLQGLALAALAAVFAVPAQAKDVLKVGKADRAATPIIPVDIGVQTGIFAKHGLDLQIANFGGGGKLHQAVAAGSVDIGIGAGPELALIAKGSPEIAICDCFPSVRFIGIAVPEGSPIKTVDDLKGKRMGVSSIGSLTYWLALQLNKAHGWGDDGVKFVAIGNGAASIVAGFRTNQVDADISATSVLFNMEHDHVAHLLIPVSDYVGNLAGGAIFATKHIIDTNPGAVRRFMAGWFETVDWMRKHKSEAVKIMSSVTGFVPAVESKEYDLTISGFSKDGKFDAESLRNLSQSFTDLKLVETPPDMSKLYTEAFLPKH